MGQAAEELRVTAFVGAAVIHAFGNILRAARDDFGGRFWDGAFFVYPHDDGALCIATEGRVIAGYLDRKGRVSQPAQFLLPEDAIAACAPREPIGVTYPGDFGYFDLPEWTQPGKVMLTWAGITVFPKMHHPSDSPEDGHGLFQRIAESGNSYRPDDYRARKPKFDPRGALSAFLPGEAEITVNLDLLALLKGSVRTFGAEGAAILRRGTEAGPVAVLLPECPDFIGLVMPMRETRDPGVPAFAAHPIRAAKAA